MLIRNYSHYYLQWYGYLKPPATTTYFHENELYTSILLETSNLNYIRLIHSPATNLLALKLMLFDSAQWSL